MQLCLSRVARWFLSSHTTTFLLIFVGKLCKCFTSSRFMITFLVNSDFPLLIIFRQRRSWRKQFPNTKENNVIMPAYVNCTAPCPLGLLLFLFVLLIFKSWCLHFSLLTMQMVEILSKWHFFLRGSFYTKKGHGIILFCIMQVPHVSFFNAWKKTKHVKIVQVTIFSRDQVDRWLLGPLAVQDRNPECLCLL